MIHIYWGGLASAQLAPLENEGLLLHKAVLLLPSQQGWAYIRGAWTGQASARHANHPSIWTHPSSNKHSSNKISEAKTWRDMLHSYCKKLARAKTASTLKPAIFGRIVAAKTNLELLDSV